MNSPTDLSQLTSQQQRALLTRLLQEKAAATGRYPMSLGQQALWDAYLRDPRAQIVHDVSLATANWPNNCPLSNR